MLALLGILAAGLLVGGLARRITRDMELFLLGLIAVIVLVEFAFWNDTVTGRSIDFLRALPGLR
jgi:hypothetical protein